MQITSDSLNQDQIGNYPNVNRLFGNHLKGYIHLWLNSKVGAGGRLKKKSKKKSKSTHWEILKEFEMPGDPQKEPTLTPVAFTAASQLHQLPLFMPHSAASIRPRLLTLHVTHSFTVPLTPTHYQAQRVSCIVSEYTDLNTFSTCCDRFTSECDSEDNISQRYMWKLTSGMSIWIHMPYYESLRCSL